MRIKLSLIMLLFASSPVFAKGGADLRWPVQDRGKMGTPPVLLLWGPIAESNHELHANWRHGVLGEAIVEIVQDPSSHLPQEYVSRFSRYMRLAYNNDNKEMTNTWSAAMDYGRTPGAWGQMATAIRIQLASEGNVLRQGEWYELALKLKPEGVSQKSFILEGYLLMQEADDGAGIAQWYQYHLTPPTPCEAACLKQEFKKAIVELLTHPPGWKEAELATLNYHEFGTTPIDWKGQDLREIDLRDRELQGLDLTSANLEGKDFRYKNLANTNLSKANLNKANLTNSNLQGAKFVSTFLEGVDLTDFDLSGADMTNANLTNADLSDSILNNIKWDGANISKTIGNQLAVVLNEKEIWSPKFHLVWQRQDDGISRDFEEAASYCNDYSLNNATDWRLPTSQELLTLVAKEKKQGRYIAPFPFPNTKAWYWTSTSNEKGKSSGKLLIGFASGFLFENTGSRQINVRCVRTIGNP